MTEQPKENLNDDTNELYYDSRSILDEMPYEEFEYFSKSIKQILTLLNSVDINEKTPEYQKLREELKHIFYRQDIGSTNEFHDTYNKLINQVQSDPALLSIVLSSINTANLNYDAFSHEDLADFDEIFKKYGHEAKEKITTYQNISTDIKTRDSKRMNRMAEIILEFIKNPLLIYSLLLLLKDQSNINDNFQTFHTNNPLSDSKLSSNKNRNDFMIFREILKNLSVIQQEFLEISNIKNAISKKILEITKPQEHIEESPPYEIMEEAEQLSKEILDLERKTRNFNNKSKMKIFETEIMTSFSQLSDSFYTFLQKFKDQINEISSFSPFEIKTISILYQTLVKNFIDLTKTTRRLSRETEISNIEKEKINKSRRKFLKNALKAAAFTATVSGGAVGLDKILRNIKESNTATPEAPSIKKPEAQKIEKEPLQSQKDLGLIIENSIPRQNRRSSTYIDSLIFPEKTSEYFLESRFSPTRVNKNKAGEKTYNFAIVGPGSGYRLEKEPSKKRSTTLADTINILMDYENLSDSELKDWIVINYKKAFRKSLKAENIKIKRKSEKGKIRDVYYNLDKEEENNVTIEKLRKIKRVNAQDIKGKYAQDTETARLTNRKKHLILHSGVSPYNDIRIPENHLRRGKTVEVKTQGIKIPITTEELSNSIEAYNKARKSPDVYLDVIVNGEKESRRSIEKYINPNDPIAKKIADFLTKNKKSPFEKARKISRFAQKIPYIYENGQDLSRPVGITLINGGGDCNNQTVLWASLMHAAELDYAIIYDETKTPDSTHVLGGIPVEIFPKKMQKRFKEYKGVYPVEITSNREIGNGWTKNSVFVGIEIKRF